MENNFDYQSYLKCPICFNFVKDPMECTSCSVIFCQKCISDRPGIYKIKSCATCRKPASFRESAFARRMVSNIPVQCEKGCGTTLTLGELNYHEEICPNRKYMCRICKFEAVYDPFLIHTVESHPKDIVSDFDINSKFNKSKTSEGKNNLIVGNNIFGSGKIDFSTDRVSRKLGENGVFYCGRPLGFSCGCCDGNCGPTNGCCCKSCMTYNCEARSLPQGSVVNRQGRVAKWNNGCFTCNITFVDRRRVTQQCFSSTSCEDCKTLKRLRNRYDFDFTESSYNIDYEEINFLAFRMLFSRSGIINRNISNNKIINPQHNQLSNNQQLNDLNKIMGMKPNSAILPLIVYDSEPYINFSKDELIRILKVENTIRLSEEAKNIYDQNKFEAGAIHLQLDQEMIKKALFLSGYFPDRDDSLKAYHLATTKYIEDEEVRNSVVWLKYDKCKVGNLFAGDSVNFEKIKIYDLEENVFHLTSLISNVKPNLIVSGSLS